MKKNMRMLSLILALLLLLGLTGCSSNNQPVYFRIALGESDSCNPFYGYKTSAYYVFSLVYDTLFEYDESHENINYKLLKSMDVSDDGLTYTLHVRDDIQWQDGEKLTADDVAFTLQMTPQYSYAFTYDTANINPDSVAVVDESTVQFQVYEDANGFLEYLSGIPVVPKHIWDQHLSSDNPDSVYEVEPTPENMVGTGLYKFYSADETSCVLQLNKNYWGGTSAADVVVLEYKLADDSLLAALQSGELDGAQSVTASAVDTVKADKNLDCVYGLTFGFEGIGFNLHDISAGATENPALLNRTVRQAIDYCVPRKYLSEMAYGGLGMPGSSFLNPNSIGYYDIAANYEGYRDGDAADNVDRAIALLEGAGFTLNAAGQPYGEADRTAQAVRYNADGQNLQFRLFIESDKVDDDSAASLIQKECAEAGIGIEISRYDQSTLWSYTDALDYDMYIIEWGGYVDADFACALFAWDDGKFDYAGDGYNDSGYSNPQYDDLYYQQRYTHDPAERVRILEEMQKIIYDDVPYIILGDYYYAQVINSSRWSGYKQLPAFSDCGMIFDQTSFRYNLLHMTYHG